MSPLLLHQLFAGTGPWAALALLLLGRNPHPGLRRKIASLLLASLLLAIPLQGWSVAAWIRVLEPNPSFTLTGLLLVALLARLSGKTLLRPQDWRAAAIFGGAAALILYPMGLGLTGMDPFAWGWGHVLPVVVAILASLLLLRGNRFGALLLLPFAGSLLHLQESTNFWNAMIDPFYAILSLPIASMVIVRMMAGNVSPLTSPATLID